MVPWRSHDAECVAASSGDDLRALSADYNTLLRGSAPMQRIRSYWEHGRLEPARLAARG